jgi:hypothetical protein
MQGPQGVGTTRIGRLTIEQFPDACKIIAPRSAGWHEFGVFYFFIVVMLALPGPFLNQLSRFSAVQFLAVVAAAVGLCRSTMRHVITITGCTIFIRREALGLCGKEDVYALERSAKLRFVPAGHGRRYSRPSVLAIDYQAKQRCFAPFITADEAAKLLALLRTRLPMWVQE